MSVRVTQLLVETVCYRVPENESPDPGITGEVKTRQPEQRDALQANMEIVGRAETAQKPPREP